MELPSDRLKTISTVRQVIQKNVPDGYEKTMNWGMIAHEVPLSRYPNTQTANP